MPPITPVSTIPHPATISEALREIEQSEPVTLDPSRWARVAGEVVPLPPVAEAATSIESEDDAE